MYVPQREGRVSGRGPYFYRTQLVAWHYKGTKGILKQARYGQQSTGLTRPKAGKRGPNEESDALTGLRVLDWRSIFRTEGCQRPKSKIVGL